MADDCGFGVFLLAKTFAGLNKKFNRNSATSHIATCCLKNSFYERIIWGTGIKKNEIVKITTA